ncbi:MAG: hypothetical protein ACOX1W_09445 [Catenisphaera adipataccumulans]|jgi:hypothetical protein|uniref:hypothetical protein n=1 Tax=Catenisphaera adipataccumulans TaxID=700500 RepID=UPI003D8D2BA5
MKKLFTAGAISLSLMLSAAPVMANTTMPVTYKIQTIGQESSKTTKITFTNKTGKTIKSFQLVKDSDSSATKNYIKKSIKKNKKFKFAYVYDEDETYSLKIGIGSKKYTVKDFPNDDAKSIRLYFEDGEVYMEYTSIETGEKVSTKGQNTEDTNTDTSTQTTQETQQTTTDQSAQQTADQSAQQTQQSTDQSAQQTQQNTQQTTQQTQQTTTTTTDQSSQQANDGGCLDGSLLN